MKTSRGDSGLTSSREGEWNLEWITEQGENKLPVVAPRPTTAAAYGYPRDLPFQSPFRKRAHWNPGELPLAYGKVDPHSTRDGL